MARLDPQGLAALVFLALHSAASFQPNFGDSVTHSAITQRAALQILLRVFQKIPSPEGNVIPSDAFQLEELTAEKLFERYYRMPTSVFHFQNAVKVMTHSNTKVDFIHVAEGRYHFDSETLAEGKDLLLTTKSRAIQNILQQNYNKALKNVGSLLHTLQDFYSHSNWIELGFQRPHSNLLKFGESSIRMAGPDEETCTECSTSHSCKDKILENTLKEQILTTGYFGFTRNSRPKGKCSHGGTADQGKRGSQGINKDTRNSPHGQYHTAAARVATEATVEVFQEIWDTVGDQAFLRFLNIRNPTGLVFVIDTTGSMRDDIEGAKQRTINIVKSRRRTHTEPSFYLLVPFNDPDFGPVFKTSDPEKFIEKLESLRADGGGDIPEMSLSALQLALTNTPPLSFIYVFTDAPAKDFSLKNTIVGLIEHTKCTVSFLLTNALSRRRRRAADGLGNQLYQELAHVSGGLAVVTQKQEISELTSIIEDMAHPDMVTVLQRDSNQDYRDNIFTFPVDTTLRNVTVYISGRPATFQLSRPGGPSQSSAGPSGDLAWIKRFGDLTVLYLRSPLAVGQWELYVSSGTPYCVKVTGQSVVNFLYNFVQPFQGPHPGFTLLPGRPMAGKESVMSVTVPGLARYPDLGIQEVVLLDPRGEVLLREPLVNESSEGSYLVTFRTLPGQAFYVQLNGHPEDKGGFRRQSPTLTTLTNTMVKVSAEPFAKVGSRGNISFTISNCGAPVSYTIYIIDNHNLIQFTPQRVLLDRNASMEGTAVISVPEGTELGTVITLTVGAMSENDLAYNIQEITVIGQDEDISPPHCAILQRSGCPMGGGGEHCSSWNWTLTAEIVENGTGEVTVFARESSESVSQWQLTVSPGVLTHINYTLSCCYQHVALMAVDVSGNARRCSYPSRTDSRATTHTLRSLSLLAIGLAMSWLLF